MLVSWFLHDCYADSRNGNVLIEWWINYGDPRAFYTHSNLIYCGIVPSTPSFLKGQKECANSKEFLKPSKTSSPWSVCSNAFRACACVRIGSTFPRTDHMNNRAIWYQFAVHVQAQILKALEYLSRREKYASAIWIHFVCKHHYGCWSTWKFQYEARASILSLLVRLCPSKISKWNLVAPSTFSQDVDWIHRMAA